MAESLQDQLLSIPGIDDAEFDGDVDAPAGVRVRLAAGADPTEVGMAVQRVLATHGMASQLSTVKVEPSEPPPPPGVPSEASVVSLPGVDVQGEVGPVELMSPAPREQVAPAPREQLAPAPQGQVEPRPAEEAAPASVEPVEPTPAPPVAEPAAREEPDIFAEPTEEPAAEGPRPRAEIPARQGGEGSLDRVSVEESRDGVTVAVVATDGRTGIRTLSASGGGLDYAVIESVGEALLGPGHSVRVLGIEESSIQGVDFISVVIEVDGGMNLVGAAVASGGRAFAIASAAWAAITS